MERSVSTFSSQCDFVLVPSKNMELGLEMCKNVIILHMEGGKKGLFCKRQPKFVRSSQEIKKSEVSKALC